MNKLNATISDGKLIIEVPMDEPKPSSTKKTLIVAGSGGVQRTEAFIDGKPVYLVFNAFVYP